MIFQSTTNYTNKMSIIKYSPKSQINIYIYFLKNAMEKYGLESNYFKVFFWKNIHFFMLFQRYEQ